MLMYVFIKEPKVDKEDICEAYDKAAAEMMSEIYKMRPWIAVTHTQSSNVILIDNRWTGPQISSNLEQIRQMKNYSGYLIVYDPLKEVENATLDHDFVKTYSLGCTLFEAYGTKILKKLFDKNNVHVADKKFTRLNLQTVIIMLYTSKQINKDEYDDLIRIIKIRNNLIIHADPTELDVKTLVETSQYFDKILAYCKKLNDLYSAL